MTGIPYPNAKAVNKTYEREMRTIKKHIKFQVTNQQYAAFDQAIATATGDCKIVPTVSNTSDYLAKTFAEADFESFPQENIFWKEAPQV